MKAKDWKFDKYFPDVEDLEAEGNCRQDFMNLHILKPIKMTGIETQFHVFTSGFYRGMAWALAKHGIAQGLHAPHGKIKGPDVMYGVAIRGSLGNYGFLAGPYPTMKEALDFEPTEDEGPIFLLQMNILKEGGPNYVPLYRWHPKLGWKPRKQPSEGMRRTT